VNEEIKIQTLLLTAQFDQGLSWVRR